MSLRQPLLLFLLAVALTPVAAAAGGEIARADDPKAEVFISDLCGGQDDGAPPARCLGKLVLLTDLDSRDPYRAIVDLLEQEKEVAATIPYPEGRIGEARPALLEHLPEFVIVATRPERIDVNLHLDLLEMAAGLDRDPFVDFAFGYVTGATPQEAVAFVERFLEAGKGRKLPATELEFGPANDGKGSYGGPAGHAVAKGWKRSFAYHVPVEDMLERRAQLHGMGMLRASGHGLPDGVVDGIKGADLRRLKIDLSPAIYFSGPCYCGVTSAFYQWQDGAFRRRQVDPMESFCLAAIASGVTALFAGLDPDRGETTSQELEHLWIHGDALGHAAKETYDGVIVALRLPKLELYRYQDGQGRPYRNLSVQMIGAGAARALFGDPTFVPWPPAAPPAFPVRMKDKKSSLELTWASRAGPTDYWSANDVYHCDGGWTHRIQFREEIPPDTAAALKSFAVAALTAEDEPLEGLFPTAMIERWGGRAFLHVYLVFPPAGQQNVFFVHRDFEARFSFGKS